MSEIQVQFYLANLFLKTENLLSSKSSDTLHIPSERIMDLGVA